MTRFGLEGELIPNSKSFMAIGTGGDDFVQAMVVAVESVIQQPIPKGRVRQKVSSRGKYVSVNIGPIQFVSSERVSLSLSLSRICNQVQTIYNAMRRDERMKYLLYGYFCIDCWSSMLYDRPFLSATLSFSSQPGLF